MDPDEQALSLLIETMKTITGNYQKDLTNLGEDLLTINTPSVARDVISLCERAAVFFKECKVEAKNFDKIVTLSEITPYMDDSGMYEGDTGDGDDDSFAYEDTVGVKDTVAKMETVLVKGTVEENQLKAKIGEPAETEVGPNAYDEEEPIDIVYSNEQKRVEKKQRPRKAKTQRKRIVVESDSEEEEEQEAMNGKRKKRRDNSHMRFSDLEEEDAVAEENCANGDRQVVLREEEEQPVDGMVCLEQNAPAEEYLGNAIPACLNYFVIDEFWDLTTEEDLLDYYAAASLQEEAEPLLTNDNPMWSLDSVPDLHEMLAQYDFGSLELEDFADQLLPEER